MLFYATGEIIPAAQVKVGDSLLTPEGFPATVKSIRTVNRQGLYAPHTALGNLVVNGVVASNYVEQEAFKRHVSPETQHWLQHAACAPYRWFCGLVGGCENETYNERGFPKAIAVCVPLLEFLEDRSFIGAAFVHLVALPGLWAVLNMASVVAAVLGCIVWKKANREISVHTDMAPTRVKQSRRD